MEISPQQLGLLMNSFPVTDLAYEIIKNDPPPTSYDLQIEMSIHIPIGPKYFVWFSTGPIVTTNTKPTHGYYLMELNRQKKVVSCRFHKLEADLALFYGTILYGTVVASRQFIIEDIYLYKGQRVSMCFEKDRWQLIWTLLSTNLNLKNLFRVPPINVSSESLTPHMFHHVQFRQLQKKTSYINYIMKPAHKFPTIVQPDYRLLINIEKPYFKSYKKPQYRELTVFKLMWESTGNDLYKLYTYGPKKTFIFYDYALVQDIKTSFALKQMFGQSTINYCRNQNLDYMEESDDEEDEQPVETCAIWVRCQFHNQFKKWIPYEKVKDFSRVVHISQL